MYVKWLVALDKLKKVGITRFTGTGYCKSTPGFTYILYRMITYTSLIVSTQYLTTFSMQYPIYNLVRNLIAK